MAEIILSDDLSVEAARRGDRAAFNRLVERYQRQAYNVAYRTLGHPEEAADATQDAFLAAFQAIRSFRGGSFRAWLLRIVVNACYDQLRRRRQPLDSLEGLGANAEVEVGPPDPGPGPEQAALGHETAEAVERALERLPVDQRLVVILCDVQGLSYEETADALELALGTVKSRLSRARARLRDDLIARGELPGQTQRPNTMGPQGQAAT